MKQEISLNHTFRLLFHIRNEVDKTTSEPPDAFTREAALSHSSLKLLFFSSTYFLNRTWLPLVCPRLRFGLLTYQAPQRMWPLTSPGGGALRPPDHKVLGPSVQRSNCWQSFTRVPWCWRDLCYLTTALHACGLCTQTESDLSGACFIIILWLR